MVRRDVGDAARHASVMRTLVIEIVSFGVPFDEPAAEQVQHDHGRNREQREQTEGGLEAHAGSSTAAGSRSRRHMADRLSAFTRA